jgi:multidrug efflux pump subunit AcrA (membrane-fusion protein)
MNLDMERLRRAIHLLLAALLISGGTGFMIGMIRTRPGAPVLIERPQPPAVEVIPAVVRPITPPVVVYGAVRASNPIQIIPQVSGLLIYVHPNLAPGRRIEKNELLLQIDPAVYGMRAQQAEAEVAALEAAQVRLDREEATLGQRIENEESVLAIHEADYQSARRLFDEQKVGAARDLDVLQEKLLRQRSLVMELRGSAASLPARRAEVLAQRDAARSRLQQAAHDLENTKIVCPFAARVESVGAFASQVVAAYQPIACITDADAFEIPVGIDADELRWLARDIRPTLVDSAPAQGSDTSEVRVLWPADSENLEWAGRLSRFERMDEQTRAAQAVVEVPRVGRPVAGRSDAASLAPSLSVGMYCRVELPAEPLEEALWVPRDAVHDNGWVFVVESAADASPVSVGRLIKRRLPMLRVAGDWALVDYAQRVGGAVCEVRTGDRVVVSPLHRPVEGMEVRPILTTNRFLERAWARHVPSTTGETR